MQRGENPNQLLSGVVFTQNQAPGELDFFDFSGATWFYQDFYFPNDYIRGTGDETNIPDFTGIQICVGVAEGQRHSAGLDWVVERYVPALGWHEEASGVSVQSHAEGPQIWYDILFDEGIQPDTDSFNHRWRFGIRGRQVNDLLEELEVPYDPITNIVTVLEHEINVKLYPDRPFPFILNGTPSILRLKKEDQKVYYSVQQGITNLWFSQPNPLETLNVWLTDENEIPITPGGNECSLLFRLMGGVGDSGVDFLGNTYREAIRRNHVRNVADVHREESDNYWLSKPNPSRFAVESMYFDMRDDLGGAQVIDQVLIDPITPGVYFQVYFTNDEVHEETIRTNYIENAHFASSMDLWTGSGVATERVTDRFYISQGSAHLTNAAAGTDYMYYRVTSAETPGIQDQLDELRGKTVTFSGWVYKDEDWELDGGSDLTLDVWDGSNQYAFGSMTALPHSTWERQSVTFTVPEDATMLEVRAMNGGTGEVWWDGFLLEEGLLGSWFQGEQIEPPPSPVSIHDWEERIWNHVPKTYQAVKRQEHVFPEPVLAKYMKVEFSHLQPRQYSAGDFAQPIAYKKHPRWVLDYFMARREADDYGENGSNFSPRRVGIRYDALDLAYNYYLDDLNQGPDEPVTLDPNAQSQFIEEFRQSATADQADADTLSRIKIVFDQFKEHPAAQSPSLQAVIGSNANYPVEYADLPAQIYDTGALRNLHKQQIVWEQTHPVMFFILPCRHRYKEVLATLKYNRAYFVGVRQIVFSRERYGVEHDSTLYVETMGDEVNMERMDFERIAEGQWVTDLGEGTIYG